jgi:hypothetical protein
MPSFPVKVPLQNLVATTDKPPSLKGKEKFGEIEGLWVLWPRRLKI